MQLLSRNKPNTQTAPAPASAASQLDQLRTAHTDLLALQAEAIGIQGPVEAARKGENIDDVIALAERADTLPSLIYKQRVQMLKLQAGLAKTVKDEAEQDLQAAIDDTAEIDRQLEEIQARRMRLLQRESRLRDTATRARRIEEKATQRSIVVFDLLAGGEDTMGIWGPEKRKEGEGRREITPAHDLRRMIEYIGVMLKQVDSLREVVELAGGVYGSTTPAMKTVALVAEDTHKKLVELRQRAGRALMFADDRQVEVRQYEVPPEYEAADEVTLLRQEFALMAKASLVTHKTGLTILAHLPRPEERPKRKVAPPPPEPPRKRLGLSSSGQVIEVVEGAGSS